MGTSQYRIIPATRRLAAERLGAKESEVQRRSEAGEFLRLRTSAAIDAWPATQLDSDGVAPTGLAAVVSALKQHCRNDDGWTAAFLLAAPSVPSDPASLARIEVLRQQGAAPLLQLIDRTQLERDAEFGRDPRPLLRAAEAAIYAEITGVDTWPADRDEVTRALARGVDR